MPKPLLTGVDWSKVYPRFMELAFQLIGNCSDQGFQYRVLSTYRDPADQLILYAQGRTAPGKIVTKVKFSAHCAGIACDVVYLLKGVPTWDPKHYVVLQNEAHKIGLVTGGELWNWDQGHVQLPFEKKGLSLGKLSKLDTAGIVKALDKAGPW
jgi:peptidoglycan L-alanyl-D-glutamate endopeptidase CwlK